MDDALKIDSLTLNGNEIPAKVGFLLQSKLKFYPENPRIYSIICAGEKKITQEEIEERLSEKEYVRILMQSIKANGGLTDPLIVRDGDMVVLEGNSRLAAYRMLSKKDPEKWAKVKCKILPSDISEELIFMLLGEYHIIGRTDWLPYEQAGYLYRRHKIQGVSLDVMEKELGLKKSEIGHLIEVYLFMLKHDDTDINRWSYYEEYLKSNYIKKVRDEFPSLDKLIVKKIKSGEIGKAIEIREKLIPIAKASSKTVKNFVAEKTDFEAAYERAAKGGAGNVVYERLHRFRSWLADSGMDDDLVELAENSKELISKCQFELGKIHKRAHELSEKLKE